MIIRKIEKYEIPKKLREIILIAFLVSLLNHKNTV